MFNLMTLYFGIIIQLKKKTNMYIYIYIFEYFHQEYFFHVFGFNMSNVFKMTSILITSSISHFNYTYF
jgi:hypothetical protein